MSNRGRGRFVSRIRTRSRRSPTRTEPEYQDLDLARIEPRRMIRYLVSIGAIPETTDADPQGSGVPEVQPPSVTSQPTLASLEALIQRLLSQAPPAAPPQPPSTATATSASGQANSGKPLLKFPDPPVFEGDPVKLDGWVTQTHMFLRAYDVDLASSRAVEVATMFLRGKAQDWWTGQFHLQSSGAVPAFGTWAIFVQALTDAFRPVALNRKYLEQMLSISQGRGDMRSYIASFNALRAKIPQAFPEETLSHLFLQGCRADLQKNIALQYPKTLADHFKHAIALSDLPGNSRPQLSDPKGQTDPKLPAPTVSGPHACAHCGKPGHTVERCFQLHPELKRRRSKQNRT